MAYYGYEYEIKPEVSSPSSEEEELIKQTFESMGSQVPFQGIPAETIYLTPSYTGPLIETVPIESVSTVPTAPEIVPSIIGNIPSKTSKKKSRKEKKWKTTSAGVPIEYESENESLPYYTRLPRTEQTEITNWSGPIPLSEYPVNQDDNPEVVTKKPEETVQYKQEVSVRYLRPPSPLAHGDIIIQHEKSIVPPPAPPVVIREQPPRPETPPPLVVREAPPKPLPKLHTKLITLPGKRVPPPPRKLIIERLPQLPPKPQPLVVERWLPFKYAKRRVIYNRPTEAEPIYEKPKNVIIQWESPNVVVNREYRDLGVARANPEEYMSKYGSTVKRPEELPDFVRAIRPPEGLVLAADVRETPKVFIEGDLEALSLVDLDKEGLSELKCLVPKQRLVSSELPQERYTAPKQSYLIPEQTYSIPHEYVAMPVYSSNKETINIPIECYTTKKDIVEEKKIEQPSFETVSTKRKSPEPYVSTPAPVFMSSHAYLASLVDSVLDSLVLKSDSSINFYEAKEFIKLLNERLNKTFSNAKAERFLESIHLNRETATMDLEAFKRAVMRNLEFYSIFMF